MPAFVSPLIDPAAWTCSLTEVALPAGLRYGGYTVRALRAQHATGANVVMPSLGILRRVTGGDGREYVEVQTDPFPIREVILRLPGGVPAFYFVFPDATGLSAADDQIAPDSEVLRATATDVTIAVVFQDRVTRDPALWTSQILAAISEAGGNATLWAPFDSAVNTQTNSGNLAPVLLLNHAGQPLRSGSVDLVFGAGPSETVRSVTMDPADLGDLQRTVRRIAPADPGLWSGGRTAFRIRPARAAAEEIQLALVEGPAGSINEITVTPAQRHVLATTLTSWFPPQFAIPIGQTVSPLARYTRGNQVTNYPNGIEFFDDLFRRLAEAQSANGRFDLAGWSMFPTTQFTKKRDGDPPNLPLTLEEAAQRIGEAGGMSRFLPARFIQLAPGSSDVGNAEIMAFYLIVTGVLILNSLGVSFARTDVAGMFILLGILFGNALLVSKIFSTGGATLEPNRDAIDVLDPIARCGAVLSPHPGQVADNTAIAQPVSGFPFDTLFSVVRNFGIYHQKFSVVQTATKCFAYCGGIDLSPNRLDNSDHVVNGPYHDVQSGVDGPAVRDLAISFNQRWERDGGGDVTTVDAPELGVLGTPGTDIVQVARTYFRPQDPVRALAFAPLGDRTIADAMLAGIAQATEFIYVADQYLTPPLAYRNAMVAKVASGDIKKLIIAVPALTDQPFGELVRSQFVTDLRNADPGGNIVRVGYPRRRFTVPNNDLRSSSGKCLVAEDIPSTPGLDPTVLLTPEARVPKLPFWLAIDGELMWAYDEAIAGAPPPAKRLRVVRGADTRLVKAGVAPVGASTREHKTGAPATVVDLTGIYVHAKMMVVDDVFLGVGSANLNRRGLFHDGEISIFTMPETLRAAPGNPIATFRRRLWADLLDLPEDMAAPLLEDPVAAAKLFDRSPFLGNRYVDIDAFPNHLMLGATTGDSLIGNLLQGFVLGVGVIDHVRLFDAIVDPSSQVENP